MKIQRFEDIEGWKLSREITRLVYSATKQPDFSKDFGLKDQIQRAAGSAMHNMTLEKNVSGSNSGQHPQGHLAIGS